MAHIVVIGAGAGGMSASARLARNGHTVTLLEQSGTVGGKLAGWSKDGFVFDTGPSLLTLPAVYRDLFAKTGAPLEDVVDLQPVDPAFAYRWADGSHALLPGAQPLRVAQALGAALGGDAELEWRRFIDHAAHAWQVTRKPFLESALSGPTDLLKRMRRWSDVRAVAPFTSLRRLGEKSFSDPRLVQLLDRYATYTGSDPRRAPAALSVVPYVEQTFGAWHIGGGLHRLATALADRNAELGVRLRTDTEVARILIEGSRAVGVLTTDGERIDADLVVSDSDASTVYSRLLRDPRAQAPLRRIQRATPSLAGFVMLLALRGRTEGLAHHNVWFPDDYNAEFDAIFGARPRPVDDPTIYVCAPNDPLMRPDDEHESWFVLVNAPTHDPVNGVNWNDQDLVARYSARVLDVMAERGVDVRQRLLWSQAQTPATLERSTRSPGGSIYGTSSNGRMAAFLRPANRSPIPGLFLVGGSAHPGGGLPLVGMSASIVTDLIGPAD